MEYRRPWLSLALVLTYSACGDASGTGPSDDADKGSVTDPNQAGENQDPPGNGVVGGANSSSGGESGGADAYPLLGSSHGGSPLVDFCQGKPASTALPPDPRALVVPGVNKGKAVYYNAFWVDCHKDPELVGEKAQPTTCGELLKRVEAGAYLMKQKDFATGAGALFSGTDPFYDFGAGYGAASIPAELFNNIWKAWDLTERPDNFDELIGERYGSGFGDKPNPYPLPGEDPNATNGGSGTLPVAFVQLKTREGKWSGNVGITCHSCHSGAVGDAEDGAAGGVIYGGGSSIQDLNLFLTDGLKVGFIPSLVYFLNLTQSRGGSNASVINVAFLFQENYDISTLPGVLLSGSTADMDTPAIWNLGHKTKKFIDGVFAADATRVDLVFYEPFIGLFGALGKAITGSAADAQDWVKQHSQDANHWFESVKAPTYPFEVDTKLAEQGAILFHSKDLWASKLNNPVPKPEGGNGSCASCHGAYSPRFLHDPDYIDTPALEGIASYIVPKDVIRTDPARVDTNNEAVQLAGQQNFFGYPETVGTENDCGPQNVNREKPGYYAQPLYGIWATAPYFHNGSVPNLWEVLKPSDRKTFWRRVSKPARPDQEGKVTMGFDYSLKRAFDFEKIGWKYDTLQCRSEDGLTPGEDCNPDNPTAPTELQEKFAKWSGSVLGAWNLLGETPSTPERIEGRKIYNTLVYARGNGGHDFTVVLTDAERRAIIEYLKTL